MTTPLVGWYLNISCHLLLLAPDFLSCLHSISCGHTSSTPLYIPFSCHEATSRGHCYLSLPAVSPEFLFALLSLDLTELFQEVLSTPQDPSESVWPKWECLKALEIQAHLGLIMVLTSRKHFKPGRFIQFSALNWGAIMPVAFLWVWGKKFKGFCNVTRILWVLTIAFNFFFKYWNTTPQPCILPVTHVRNKYLVIYLLLRVIKKKKDTTGSGYVCVNVEKYWTTVQPWAELREHAQENWEQDSVAKPAIGGAEIDPLCFFKLESVEMSPCRQT